MIKYYYIMSLTYANVACQHQEKALLHVTMVLKAMSHDNKHNVT